jgi:hypothetical protein
VSEIFGPLVTPTQVQFRALAVLKEHFESYLGWIERETGRDKDALAVPSWTPPRSTVDEWPEDVPPVLTVLSTGTEGDPRRDGEGFYSLTRRLGVVCFVEAADEESSRSLAEAYGAAIVTCLSQQPWSGPDANAKPIKVERVTFAGDDYDIVPWEKTRSLAAAQAEFLVTVSDVFTDEGGYRGDPQADPRDEYADAVPITEVEISRP